MARLIPRLLLLLSFAGAARADTSDSEGIPHSLWGLKGCEHGEGAAQCMFRTGRGFSGEKAKESEKRADALERSALQRAELSDQIGADRRELGQRLEQLSRLEQEEALRQKNRILDQGYEARPARDASHSSRSLQAAMRELGLSSQRDLWQKGPEVQRALQAAAERDAGEAATLFRQARQGRDAEGKLGKMGETTRLRQAGARSLAAAAPATGSRPGEGGAPGAAGSPARASGEPGGAAGRLSELSKGTGGAGEGWSSDALDAAIQRAKNDPAARNSLREKLKAALAAARAKGDRQEAARLERSVAALDRQGKEGTPEEGLSRAPASIVPAAPPEAERSPAFALNGADRQAVGAMISEFERSLEDKKENDGDDPRSLFERVHSTLHASLSAGRIR